jgi:dolichol kinase
VKSRLLRPALHAGTALLLLALLDSERAFRAVLVVAGLAAVALEALRLGCSPVRDLAARLVPVFRPREAARPSGAAWLFLGYALCAWMPLPATVSAVLAGALADPAAAVVGGRFGRGRPKSWPGTLAVFVMAVVLLRVVVHLHLPPALLAGLVAALLERWPGPFDDNLLIAPGVGLSVWWLGS